MIALLVIFSGHERCESTPLYDPLRVRLGWGKGGGGGNILRLVRLLGPC